jgi:curved DNA-binding protein CbpA
MGSELPPDPYLALGVAKDASAAAIKSQYRKLVLKFHPDKVQDDSQKQIAADQFHKVQTAWEIVGDDDKRKRYDAQCELAQLRKDIMSDKHGGGGAPRGGVDVRTAAYKMPTESPGRAHFYARGPERMQESSPTYEERRPAYASPHSGGDYFDYAPPRGSARKEPEYERSAKRSSPRDDRDRTRSARETKDSREKEKARQTKEKSRRSDKDMKRDRDRKAFVVDEDTDSDDDYRRARTPREDPAELRRAADAYHEQARLQKEAAQRGYYDADERARKLYSQYDEARGYQDRTRTSHSEQRRPASPARMPSAKDAKVEYIKRDGRGAPAMARRSSGRPTSSRRDTEERRPTERRSGDEYETAPRRPPILSQSKSSPAEIRIPNDKPRAQSMQIDPSEKEDMLPKMKRADSMPIQREREQPRRRETVQKASGLRQTEHVDGLPTPAASPVDGDSSPSKKYSYQKEYADDHEYPTPDGYRTETRRPEPTPANTSKPRITRSPDAMQDRDRRAGPVRYEHLSPHRPTSGPRTTSTSYAYTPGHGVTEFARPPMSRENSGSRGLLFNEIPQVSRERGRETRSPRQSRDRYSPPADGVRYQRHDDVRMQTGFNTTSRRMSDEKPSLSRGGSYVYARS